MKRIKITPRHDYQTKIKDLGFYFNEDYWIENAYYSFTEKEIEVIEDASNECYKMYVDAVQHIIDNDLFSKLHIPSYIIPALKDSWNRDDLSLYGRFDFAMKDGVPKLLEFNADTPTSLLEASVIQWHWKEELFPKNDQFNSIHESLVESWSQISSHYGIRDKRVYFASIQDAVEDETTVLYLSSTAAEAGLNTSSFDISELVYDSEDKCFLTPCHQEVVNYLFKLYPYEWMFEEEFGKYLDTDKIKLFEPLWKAIMSNKYILKVLSDLFPNSPYILKCNDFPLYTGDYCKKPIYSREGANVELVKDRRTVEQTSGDYGAEGYIYQELVEIEPQDGMYPVIGSWIVGGEACGMGIRENVSRISDNMSYFIPHIIE